MNSLDRELTARLALLRTQGCLRELRRIDSAQSPRIVVGGRVFLNFSSNDYLGLANDGALKQAAVAALQRYGAGAGASRLICGSLSPYHELEEAIAEFKATEAALTFSTGYATGVGALAALAGKNDIVILDRLVHASLIDGARLSGAKLRVFRHNDLNHLEAILKWAAPRIHPPNPKEQSLVPRALIVTESVFSMDGDTAPLREIADLKERYGAWLMVDEAHATGLYGAHRRGLAEEMGVSDRIDVQMGTLGKALGASGGFISGSRILIDYLVNRARSFIFSTAPVPAAAAAATAAIRFVQSEAGERRRNLLRNRVEEISSSLPADGGKRRSAILPIIVGDEAKALQAADALREAGVFIPAIRYPTVARGAARLRLTLTAAHTRRDVAHALSVLKALNLGLRSTNNED
jgi:8-amino-7-oxononanoate synthase